MARILVVDDELHMRRVLALNLRKDQHLVTECSGVAEARRTLLSDDFDVVLTDQKMPDGEGLEVLAAAHETDPAISVIVITAFATVELAVESMRQGAFDFITKPFQPEVVLATTRRAVERTKLLRENDLLKGAVDRLEGSSEILGGSPAMRELREVIGRVAPTPATVLITGETGTGKELVARAIHKCSPRASKPFVPVNCAAFTETLLESELFGHEKGAFTGADRARQGLFEAAHEGTLFLDEVAEMSPAAQAKLLRVLTDGQVLRIGTTRPRQVDVRLLAATHRDLRKRAAEGLFREDLFYRLAVVPIAISPLRERPEDLSGLCDFFLGQVALELKLPRRSLTPAALEKLRRYEFPGNVRELRNLIERASILSDSEQIRPEAFPVSPGGRQSGPGTDSTESGPASWLDLLPPVDNLRAFLTSVEKGVILRALDAAGGAQAEAARHLGLSRSDLGYKLTKLGIRNPEP
ncbi:MAG TPA: sigma-54 dependent transcriptional regulator [Terriglobia bacterium]|nr:sigma-54 dependent transcriptional regulator [Terriglobia bacterium]